MRRLISCFLILCFFNTFVVNAATVIEYENVELEEFGAENLNDEDFEKEAEKVKDLLIKISEVLQDFKNLPNEIELQDLSTEAFKSLPLSEQLRIFKQNYENLNNFTLGILEDTKFNEYKYSKFFSLQSELFVHYGKMYTIAEKIMKSQSEDLQAAIQDIQKANATAESMKIQLEICRRLAEEQLEKYNRLKGWAMVGGPALFILGCVGGFALSKFIFK